MWLTGRWARHQELTPIVKAAQYFPQFVLPFRYEVAAALPLVCAAESVVQILPCFEAEGASELKEGEFVCSSKQGEVHRVDVWGSEVEWFEREAVLEVLAGSCDEGEGCEKGDEGEGCEKGDEGEGCEKGEKEDVCDDRNDVCAVEEALKCYREMKEHWGSNKRVR